MCAYAIEHFGRNRSVESLTPDDFGELRAKMAARWATSGLVARINNIRQIFHVIYRNGVIDKEVRFGDQFSPPSKRQRRHARNARGQQMFEPPEIHKLLEVATPHLRAFILLATNTGIGNADISRMEHRHIDLETGWLDYARGKTGVPRRAKLWAETCEAINTAVETQPKSTKYSHLVFVTRNRSPWSNPTLSSCAISNSFSIATKRVGVYKRGKGFYALRHVAETIGGECRDQVAVDVVMGHDTGISSQYRERISDERLEAVADTIHTWLYRSGGKPR